MEATRALEGKIKRTRDGKEGEPNNAERAKREQNHSQHTAVDLR